MYSHKRFVLGALLKGTTQQNIADLVGMRQPSIHYVLNSTLTRCVQYDGLRQPGFVEVRKHLGRHLEDAKARECVMAMYRHRGNQTLAGKCLGRSQAYVRYHYNRGLEKLPKKHAVTDWLSLPKHIEPRWEQRDVLWAEVLPKNRPGGKGLHRKAKKILGVA